MNYKAVIIAIIRTVGMFIAGFVIPVLGQLVALFTPVPLILVYVSNSRLEAFVALIVSSAIIGLLAGWHAAALLLLSFGLMAIGIAEGMRRKWKPESSALFGGILPVVVLSIITAYYFTRIQKNPVAALEEYLNGSMAEAAKFYIQLGLKDMAAAIQSVSDRFVHYLVRLIPGITIATSVFQAACCYGLSHFVLVRRPGNATALPRTALSQWHAPDAWVWGLIVGLGLVLVPDESARFVGLNLTIIYTILYLVQGVAVVDNYLRRARIQTFIRSLIHTLILLLPSIVFVIALGVVDIWADFRKVRRPAIPQ